MMGTAHVGRLDIVLYKHLDGLHLGGVRGQREDAAEPQPQPVPGHVGGAGGRARARESWSGRGCRGAQPVIGTVLAANRA